MIYLVLRDYFDAISVFPFNTIALGAALVIQLVLLELRSISISAATALGFATLGIIMLALWKASACVIGKASQDSFADL